MDGEGDADDGKDTVNGRDAENYREDADDNGKSNNEDNGEDADIRLDTDHEKNADFREGAADGKDASTVGVEDGPHGEDVSANAPNPHGDNGNDIALMAHPSLL